MDYTAAKILAQIQKTKPTRIKIRSRRNASSIFCFLHGYLRRVPGEDLNKMSLGKPASIVRVRIASCRSMTPRYSRKTFLFCRPLRLWMLLKKLKIRESCQGNLQILKLIRVQ